MLLLLVAVYVSMLALHAQPFIAQPYYSENKIRLYNKINPAASDPFYTIDVSADINTAWGFSTPSGLNSILIYNNKLFASFDFGWQGGVLIYNLSDVYPVRTAVAPTVISPGGASGTSSAGMTINPANGDLYIATFNANHDGGIYKATAASNYTSVSQFSSYSSDASVAGVCANLAFDANGYLWMSTFDVTTSSNAHFIICYKDLNNKANFYKITNTPTASYSAVDVNGTTHTNLHLLSSPEGISFDASGNLWIGNNNDDGSGDNVNPAGSGTLVKIKASRLATILAGVGSGTSYTIPAADATLHFIPNAKLGGLIFNGNNLYINDQGQNQGGDYTANGTVWKWDATTAFNASNFLGSGIKTTYPGNGLLAFTPIYYSKSSGSLSTLGTWGTKTDGTGTALSDFTTAIDVYQLANRASYPLAANLTAAGILNIPTSSQLQIGSNTLSVGAIAGTGTITGSSTSNLTIGGSNTYPSQVSFTTGTSLNNFTVNNTSAIATTSVGNASYLKVVGNHLTDHAGNTVQLRGVNIPAYHTGYVDDMIAVANAVKNNTKANAVRLNWFSQWYVNRYSSGQTYLTNSNLDLTLNAYISRGIVPILDLHDLTGGTDVTEFNSVATTFWTDPAIQLILKKYQKNLIINLANEWGAYGDGSTWLTTYSALITKLRADGINTPIVVDCPGYAIDYNTVLGIYSGTTTYGAQLIANDPLHNILLSVHGYWSVGNGNLAACSDYTTHVDNLANSGLPFILGEASNWTVHAAAGYQDIAVVGTPSFACNMANVNSDAVDYNAILNEAMVKGIGYFAWSWYQDGAPSTVRNVYNVNSGTSQNLDAAAGSWPADMLSSSKTYGLNNASVANIVNTVSTSPASFAGTNGVNIVGSLTVTNGTLNTNDNVVLKSTSITNTAMVGIVGGTINGNVTIERFIPGLNRSFRFLSPGVTTATSIKANWQEGQNNTSALYANNSNTIAGYGTHISGSTTGLNGFDATLSGNASMFTFANAAQNWTNISNTNSNILSAGSAYRILVRGSRAINLTTNNPVIDNTTLRTTGTLKTGTVIINSTGVGANVLATPLLSTTNGNYNFIGNPYWAPVDWTTVTKTNISSTYYVWDPTVAGTNNRGAYVSFNGITNNNLSSSVNKYIQPGQAFFVQTNGAAPSLSFAEANKAINTANLTNTFRTSEIYPKINVQLFISPNSTSADGTVLVFGNSFNKNVADEDANKLDNLDENIAVNNNNVLLSIDGRPLPTTTDTIHLKWWNLLSSAYTLQVKASNFEFLPGNIFLYDKYKNAYYDIDKQGSETNLSISITDAASKAEDRFAIVFSKPTISLTQNLKVSVSPNPVAEVLTVTYQSLNDKTETVLKMISSNGTVVKTMNLGKIHTGNETINMKALSRGAYTLVLVNDENVYTQQIIKQ